MKPVLNEKFNLSSWALNHQQMVSFFMLLIIAMGAFCYENLPRNEDPAFTIKTAVGFCAMARGIRNGYHPTADRYAGKKAAGNPLA